MADTESAPSTPEALLATWAEARLDPVALDHAPTRTTLRRVARSSDAASSERTMSPFNDVEIGAVIGEGGMGVVHAARQRSLRREVAVKRLRTSGTGAEPDERLLREAEVTGALEHPNVVPIHLLARDEQGMPLIVMKRIDGRPWSQLLLADADQRGSEAFLRRHLPTLVQVARALHFAHSRRILHRDVKPDNVMIGSFGEVYLVDWGIAVGLDPCPVGVPDARSVDRIEGTPVYLAPEMAAATGTAIDERSDVYLLGATLHEVVTGEPPHLAPTAHGAVVHAFLSEPPVLDASVPRELATTICRALARDPADRFPTAEAFADALDSFLVRRSASILRVEASRRASELVSLAAQMRAAGSSGPTDEAGLELARIRFHEARFAFDQVIAAWPEDDDAREGRRALTIAMVEFELDRGASDAALALLPAVDEPPAALLERARGQAAASRARREALERVAHDADPSVGASGRRALTYLAGVSWGLSLLATGFLTRSGIFVVDHLRFALINAGFLVGTAVAMVASRRVTLGNAASRRVAYTTGLVFLAGVVLWPLFGHVGVSMPNSTLVGSVVSALLWTTAVFSLGPPWLPMVVGQIAVAGCVAMWPTYHFEIFGVGGAVQTVLAGRLMMTQHQTPSRQG